MSNDPVEKAKASLGEAWKAAKVAAEGVKKEIERAGIARSFEDAGREIARATTSVASHLGAELEELGREIRIKAEGAAASTGHGPSSEGQAPGASASPAGTPDARASAQSGDSPPAEGGKPPAEGGGGVRIVTD